MSMWDLMTSVICFLICSAVSGSAPSIILPAAMPTIPSAPITLISAAGLLHLGADQKPRRVGQEQQRHVEGVTEPDEARGLVGGVHVERAAEHHRIVGDDADREAADADESGDEILGPLRLHLEELAAVGEGADELPHVVALPRIVGDDRGEIG